MRALTHLIATLLLMAALSANAQPPTDEEKEDLARTTVEAFFDAMAAGDVDGVSRLLTGRYAKRKTGVLETDGYASRMAASMEGLELVIFNVNLERWDSARVFGALMNSQGVQREVQLVLRLEDLGHEWAYLITGEVTTPR